MPASEARKLTSATTEPEPRFTDAHPGMDISRGNIVRKAWLNALPWQPLRTGERDQTAGCKSAICKNHVMTSGTHSIEFACLVKTGWHRYGVCHPRVDPTQIDSPSRDTDRGWSIYAGGTGSNTPEAWAGNFEHNSSYNPWDGMCSWEQGDTVRLVVDETERRTHLGDMIWSLTVFLKQKDKNTFKQLGVATDNRNGVVLSGPLCWHVEMSHRDEAVRIQRAVSIVASPPEHRVNRECVEAATIMQAWWRMQCSRRNYLRARRRIQRRKEQDAVAATKLQAVCRMWFQRSEFLEYKRRARGSHTIETVSNFISLAILIVCCIAFVVLTSGAVQSAAFVNDTAASLVPRVHEGSSDFIVWALFASGDITLRGFTVLSMMLFIVHWLCRGIVQGIEICNTIKAHHEQTGDQQENDTRGASSALSETQLIQGILTAVSCAFAWLPLRSTNVVLDDTAQTSLRMFAVLLASLLLWAGELFARLTHRCSLKHSDTTAILPICTGSCASHGSVPSLKPEMSEMLTSDAFKDFNGRREQSCLPARLQRYKKHCEQGGQEAYVRDFFFVHEKYDRASYLARQVSMQRGDAADEQIRTGHAQATVKLLHDVQQLHTTLLHWGRWLIPVTIAAQWVNAVLQATVGFLLVMWSGWLALDNRQWEFERNFEEHNFRAVSLPAIGLGVICAGCAMFCFLRPQRAALPANGRARPAGLDSQPEEQEVQQLTNAVFETQRLAQLQTFGSLVIFVAKMLYWVGKDNFSGVVYSDLDEDLVLFFAALVVWWTICVIVRLHAHAKRRRGSKGIEQIS